MSNDNEPEATVDPIDESAAQIDARSQDAPELIEELAEQAEQLGRDVDLPDLEDPSNNRAQ